MCCSLEIAVVARLVRVMAGPGRMQIFATVAPIQPKSPFLGFDFWGNTYPPEDLGQYRGKKQVHKWA